MSDKMPDMNRQPFEAITKYGNVIVIKDVELRGKLYGCTHFRYLN